MEICVFLGFLLSSAVFILFRIHCGRHYVRYCERSRRICLPVRRRLEHTFPGFMLLRLQKMRELSDKCCSRLWLFVCAGTYDSANLKIGLRMSLTHHPGKQLCLSREGDLKVKLIMDFSGRTPSSLRVQCFVLLLVTAVFECSISAIFLVVPLSTFVSILLRICYGFHDV